MVKVKICGITSAADARLASNMGADALGFNFIPSSPRYLTRERARAIISSLPPFITPVGVFADALVDEVYETCEYCGILAVQLHGNESVGYVDKLHRFRRIKAVRVSSEGDLRILARYNCEAFLLDASVPGMLGGTGKTFDWELARSVSAENNIILAGGLTPKNVAEAIRVARPYAVDVASGVESEPGVKDRRLITEFISEAKYVIG